MNPGDMVEFEASVRDANPYPLVDEIVESEVAVQMNVIVAERVGDALVPGVHGRETMQTHQRTPLQTTDTPRRPRWIAAVAAFVGVIAIGIGLNLAIPTGELDTPASETTLPPAPTTTLEATPTTLSGPEPVQVSIELVGEVSGIGTAGLVDVAQVGESFVAVTRRTLWYSADGVDWERAEFVIPDYTESEWSYVESQFYAIAAKDGRAVATGTFGDYLGIWISDDEGRTWITVDGQPSLESDLWPGTPFGMYRVVAFEEGFIGAGSGFWFSADGLTWERTVSETGYIDDMIRTPEGWVAVGTSGDVIAKGTIWSSANGRAWVLEHEDSWLPVSGSAAIWMSSIAATDEEVLVGGSRHAEPTVWVLNESLLPSAPVAVDVEGLISKLIVIDGVTYAIGENWIDNDLVGRRATDRGIAIWARRNAGNWVLADIIVGASYWDAQRTGTTIRVTGTESALSNTPVVWELTPSP